ncbi:MAG TPA: UDP-N-acetylglucosamine 2-epimerase (non-hydrolyzing) [Candidatus Baltobacteraceae bacterium]|jgi:UDP-N-acetylglucosamine 2-epimerase (non-hydrolysing)|nr:UDP-N-acetylglucosamine 2-epimerase (non-hydrolyzing) [Candidatus Baltobacteraceae bacterium]
MRVVSVVGARPQFVKAALLSREFRRRGVDEYLVHTGQHYDERMSDVFFDELGIPVPSHNLDVGSASPAAQTAEMMLRLEPVAEKLEPDCMLVYGDTNSTLAGALVASKMGLALVHVEAGLRSFDRSMPEEVNRLVTDRLSDLLLAPSASAVAQLRGEGIDAPIEIVGDLMVDLATKSAERLPRRPEILDRFALRERGFAVATIHRAANTANSSIFERLIAGLRACGMPVVFPVHPRTRALAEAAGVGAGDGIIVCEPLTYLEMLALQVHARAVITDSGGMQKEAIAVGTPCTTLRDSTEWKETLEGGWNVLAGADPKRISESARRERPVDRIHPFGSGESARCIVDAMYEHIAVRERAQSCAS